MLHEVDFTIRYEIRKENEKPKPVFLKRLLWISEESEEKLAVQIWSHAKYNSELRMKGNMEPIVGRECSHKGVSRELRSRGLCWVPGSIPLEAKTFKTTTRFGIWEVPQT